MFKKYLWNVLISIDQFVNTLFGGDPDETISSRLGKMYKKSTFAYIVCKFLSIFDKRHCEKAIEADEGNNSVL